MQSISIQGGLGSRLVTEGGVEDEQLIRMERWEVAILVIATD